MKAEPKMTEQQFISMFKKKGFELYKTKDLAPKIRAFHKMKDTANKIK